MDLASNVRQLRKAKGLSREALAVRAGISYATVGRIESGTFPSQRTIRQLAAALDVTVTELLSA